MTGSYPIRVGEPGNKKLLHTVPHPQETTMAEVLKDAGYATGMVGKWHLTLVKNDAPGGFDPITLPNAQSFDSFYGTPLFNGTTVLLTGKSPTSPRDEYLYYAGCLLTGVRSGSWKLVLPRPSAPAGLAG